MIGKRKHPTADRVWRMTLRRTALVAAAGIAAAMLMPAAQAFAGVPASTARSAPPVRVQNARAVAKPAAAANQATWFSGTVAPGGVQEWVWHNTNPGLVYIPGLDPQGAATNNSCQFQVTSTGYSQQPGGETEFHFDIQNVGTLACGTNILLTWTPDTSSFAAGGINAGATVTEEWFNNINLASFQVGLVPSGATSTNACQIQISNLRYSQLGANPRSFLFDLTNTGGIACAATVLLAHTQGTVITTNELAGGASESFTWHNAAAGLVFFIGAEGIIDPTALLSDCELRVTRTWYSQVINPPAEREFNFTITNIGGIGCNTEALLNSIS